MSFSATKREWSELYSFFRILVDGVLLVGTEELKIDKEKSHPVSIVQREEHDGTRLYIVDGENIHIVGAMMDRVIPRELFGFAAVQILSLIKESSDNLIDSSEEIEAFLDEVDIYNLTSGGNDQTCYQVAFYSVGSPFVGVTLHSRLGNTKPLLDGGRTANLKFELTNVKLPSPTISKINALESANEVTDRMFMIEQLGGILKYADVADKVFRCNLQMIDLHFPRLVAEMVRTMYLEGISSVADLTERMKVINPLKIKDELINKHLFYEYKMKQFLSALALGMRPAKIFRGHETSVSGIIYMNAEGDLLLYQKSDQTLFEDFLYKQTRFERGSLEKDKYGYVERENGTHYFKLNLKIGFLKR